MTTHVRSYPYSLHTSGSFTHVIFTIAVFSLWYS